MTAIVWNAPGAKLWRAGVNRGVLYPIDADGVAWNGLVNVTENVSGGDLESYYYDGRKYLDVILSEDFQATVEAYGAPAEFGDCDGSRQLATGLFVTGQPRKPFNLAYRNELGNDLEGLDHGYELHLIWNCMASPSEKIHSTLNESPELARNSWVINTAPPMSSIFKPTAHFIINSTAGNPNLDELETILYGSEEENAILPSQQEVIDLLLPSG